MSRNKFEIEELLMEYPDGDLGDIERKFVEKSLEESHTLRAFYERSRRVWELLDAWEEVEPSPGYVARFWNRLESEENGKRNFVLSAISSLRFGLGAAALVATLVVASLIALNAFNARGPAGVEVGRNVAATGVAGTARKSEDLLLLDAASTDSQQSLDLYGPWESPADSQTQGDTEGESTFYDIVRPADYGSLYY